MNGTLHPAGPQPRLPIARFAVLIAACWTCTIVASLAWNERQGRSTILKVAIAEANAAIDKDFAYRGWSTRLGGIYVPVTKDTPPNPYLTHIPRRDVRTEDGVELTLVNPSYMMRQVAEAGAGRLRHAGHLTSLKPLRPANAPDEWEAAALRQFESGRREVSGVEVVNGIPHLRLMRRFDTEPGCLRCHAQQGYKVGDVRGGLSISTPLAGYEAFEQEQVRSLFAWHGLLWLVGMVALVVGTRRFGHHVRASERAQQALVDTTTRLRESERNLREAQRITRIGSWELAPAPDSGRWSDEIYRILERDPSLPPSEAAFLEVVHPDDRELVRRSYRAAVENRRPYDVTHRLVMKDGRVKVVHGHGELIDGGREGRPLRMLGTLQDVTDHRKLEEQFRQVQKMEAVGRLAGGVAHDFNNIVTVILSFGRFLLDTLPADDARRSDVEEIIKAGDRAASLTRQLLAFGRRTATQPTVLDLNDVVADMEKMIRRILGEDVEVRVLPAPDLHDVRIDVTHVEQVLTNLVVNARDAMRRGGRLTVETSNVDVTEDYPPRRGEGPPGPYVLLAVSDTGEGMTPEVREHVFEPFFTTKKDRGTGLGLATVYGIVKQAGGFIHVYSEAGQGSTFRIYLPGHDPSTSPSARAVDVAADARGIAAGRTILVVEDEAPLRRAVRRMLEHRGFTVVEAATGGEALAVLSPGTTRIDVVLTDVVMPGMSGPELASALRKIRPGVPVLFMSGYTENAMQHRAGMSEFTHLLAKPFTADDLVRKITELLPAS